MKTNAVCRQAGRAIFELMGVLVAARLARSPGADEAGVRRDIWRSLRDHAGLEDPNRLDRGGAAEAVWVLSAMLELEKDAGRREASGA